MTPPRFELRLAPSTANVAALLDALEEFSAEAALPGAITGRLMLLAEELAANVVMHGAGAGYFALSGEAGAGGLRLVFEDDGPAFDPLAGPPADAGAALEARAVGGMGLHLIQSLAMDARYERSAGRNRLSFRLGAE